MSLKPEDPEVKGEVEFTARHLNQLQDWALTYFRSHILRCFPHFSAELISQITNRTEAKVSFLLLGI